MTTFEEDLFGQLCRLYWLKPADVPWDFEVLSYVRARIPVAGVVLDVGCGDGIASSLALGGTLPLTYDRYAALTGKYQRIGPGQADDLFENKLTGVAVTGQFRQIDIGVDPKEYHLQAARMTNTYCTLLRATCEEINLPPGSVDFAMAIFSLYWVDDLTRAVRNIASALRSGGEFVTVMPTEFNGEMHGTNLLLEAYKANGARMGMTWFSAMEGNRRQFVNRHAGSRTHWEDFFGRFGLRMVAAEPCIHFQRFFLQDTFQRGLFPYFLACSDEVKTPEERMIFIEKFTKPVARAILTETNALKEKEPSAYYLLTLRKVR